MPKTQAPSEKSTGTTSNTATYTKKAFIAVLITAAVAVVLIGIWYFIDVLLMNRISSLFTSALGFISTSLGGLVSLLVIIVLAIYFAGTPDDYRNGAIILLPPSQRERIKELTSTTAHGLRWWLLATPLTLIVIIAVKELYLNDFYGENVETT